MWICSHKNENKFSGDEIWPHWSPLTSKPLSRLDNHELMQAESDPHIMLSQLYLCAIQTSIIQSVVRLHWNIWSEWSIRLTRQTVSIDESIYRLDKLAAGHDDAVATTNWIRWTFVMRTPDWVNFLGWFSLWTVATRKFPLPRRTVVSSTLEYLFALKEFRMYVYLEGRRYPLTKVECYSLNSLPQCLTKS